MESRNALTTFVLAAMAAVIIAGCGKDPVPPPFIPPQPVPGTPGIGGGACGAVIGDYPVNPPRNEPFFAKLPSYFGGQSNSLSVQLSYLYYDFNKPQQNVVGSGSLAFADIQRLVPVPMNGLPTTFCVNSLSLDNGQPTPGTLILGSNQGTSSSFISLSLRGFMDLPLPAPQPMYPSFPGSYGGYPQNYGYQTTGGIKRESLEVSIGEGCGAQLVSGKIVGCISIVVGTGPTAQKLQFQAAPY